MADEQNFNFQASLNNNVSEELKKIDSDVKNTSKLMGEFGKSAEAAGTAASLAFENTAQKIKTSMSEIRQSLTEGGALFKDFQDQTTSFSRSVSQATGDVTYSREAKKRVQELDDDLSSLNKKFDAFATQQTTTTSAARSMGVTSKDSINKKIIPAFSKLHTTLSDYPDTLENINKFESERLEVLEKQPGILSKVTSRVENLGSKLENIQFGFRDAAAALVGGYVGATGLQVQDQQRAFTLKRGTDNFDDLPFLFREIAQEAQAPIENIAHISEAMNELRSTTLNDMPKMVDNFYKIEKATGITGDRLVDLYDTATRLNKIKGNEFLGLLETAKGLADESTASMEDMVTSLGSVSDQLLAISKEGRAAFAQSAMAASAAAKDMGLAPQTAEDLRRQVLDSPELAARYQGILSSTGDTRNIRDLLKDPAEFFDAVSTSFSKQFGSLDLQDPVQRRAFRELSGGMDPELFLRMREGVTTTGEGTGGTAVERAAQAQQGAFTGNLSDVAQRVRGLFTEEQEQLRGQLQSKTMIAGEELIRFSSNVIGKIEELADRGNKVFHNLDDSINNWLSKSLAILSGYGAGRSIFRGFGIGEGRGITDFLRKGSDPEKGFSLTRIVGSVVAVIAGKKLLENSFKSESSEESLDFSSAKFFEKEQHEPTQALLKKQQETLSSIQESSENTSLFSLGIQDKVKETNKVLSKIEKKDVMSFVDKINASLGLSLRSTFQDFFDSIAKFGSVLKTAVTPYLNIFITGLKTIGEFLKQQASNTRAIISLLSKSSLTPFIKDIRYLTKQIENFTTMFGALDLAFKTISFDWIMSHIKAFNVVVEKTGDVFTSVTSSLKKGISGLVDWLVETLSKIPLIGKIFEQEKEKNITNTVAPNVRVTENMSPEEWKKFEQEKITPPKIVTPNLGENEVKDAQSSISVMPLKNLQNLESNQNNIFENNLSTLLNNAPKQPDTVDDMLATSFRSFNNNLPEVTKPSFTEIQKNEPIQIIPVTPDTPKEMFAQMTDTKAQLVREREQVLSSKIDDLTNSVNNDPGNEILKQQLEIAKETLYFLREVHSKESSTIVGTSHSPAHESVNKLYGFELGR